MSIASVAASQAAASASGTSSSSGNDLASLSANQNTFLNLLMTQLKNQDPTSPLDTSQFTSQLVQYSSVEQQIKTNSSLNSLIQLTQGNELINAAPLLDHTVEVAGRTMPLQNGKAAVKFNADTTGPVGVVVTDSSGRQVASASLRAAAGSNTWTWNGKSSAGVQQPDGSYNVTVTQTMADGSSQTLATTVLGTATQVLSDNTGAVQLELGQVTVPFSSLRAVEPTAGAN